MSIAAGRARIGRSTRRGSTRPGLLGRAAGAVGGALRARGGAAGMRRRRGRGITSRELRGFRKVSNLLARVGMVPKRLGRRGARVIRRES
jgi:hypothetical protein